MIKEQATNEKKRGPDIDHCGVPDWNLSDSVRYRALNKFKWFQTKTVYLELKDIFPLKLISRVAH